MDVPSDYPPIKIKQGYGDAVCGILLSLLERIGHEFHQPHHRAEAQAEEADVDEDAALDADGIDDEVGDATEDEDDLYYGGGGVAVREEVAAERSGATTIQASVEPEAWRLELERVLPQLKVQVVSDGKEWRTHITTARTHHEAVVDTIPALASALERLRGDTAETLERVRKTEQKLNAQCEEDVAAYATRQAEYTAKQEEYNAKAEVINKLTAELNAVTEELRSIKSKMDEKGSAMTDTSPIVKIKNALNKLKQDTRAMDVRVGIVSHSLQERAMRASSVGRDKGLVEV